MRGAWDAEDVVPYNVICKAVAPYGKLFLHKRFFGGNGRGNPSPAVVRGRPMVAPTFSLSVACGDSSPIRRAFKPPPMGEVSCREWHDREGRRGRSKPRPTTLIFFS